MSLETLALTTFVQIFKKRASQGSVLALTTAIGESGSARGRDRRAECGGVVGAGCDHARGLIPYLPFILAAALQWIRAGHI